MRRRRLRSARRKNGWFVCVRNARSSVRQILNVLNSNSRGKKRRHDEPRSDASSHQPRPPRQHRVACGGAPAPPPPLPHRPARPHDPRVPHRQAHHGRCSLAGARLLLPVGVSEKRQRLRRLRQVALLIHPGRLKSYERGKIRTTGFRLRKTSGNPRDYGASTICRSSFGVFFFHLSLLGCVCITFPKALPLVLAKFI